MSGATVVLIGGDRPEAPMQVLEARADGSVHALPLPADGAPLPVSAPCVLVIPAEAVTLLRVALPPATEAQARAAVPWLIEDRIAAPVSTQQVALGPPPTDAGEARLVAVIDQARLRAWCDRALALGARVDAVVPDALLFDEGLIEDAGDRVIVAGHGAVARDLAPLVVPAWLHEARHETLVLASATPEAWDGALTAPDRALSLRPPRSPDERARALARAAARQPLPLSLLQGGFAPRPRAAHGWRAWRLAALLAVLALLLHAGVRWQHTARLHAEAAALTAGAAARFTALTGVPAGAALADQVAARLRTAPDADRPALFKAASALHVVLERAPGVRLDALQVEQAGGPVQVRLSAGAFPALAAVREQLAGSGARVEQGAIVQAEGRVSADFAVVWP